MQSDRGSSLKLIIMSATLDAAAFAHYLGGSKIVYIQVTQADADIMPGIDLHTYSNVLPSCWWLCCSKSQLVGLNALLCREFPL